MFYTVSDVNDLHLTQANMIGGEAAGIAIGAISLFGDSVSGKIRSPGGSASGLASEVSQNVINCSSSAGISAGTSTYAGGLVAGATGLSGVIQNSHFTGYVRGGTAYVGGLAGESNVPIVDSWSSGSVTASPSAQGVNIGGLVGYGSVSNSYSTGNVTASGYADVGGLVGHAGSISNSYATGTVTGGSYSTVGGLAGFTQGAITNSYASATVVGGDSAQAGGLAGQILESSVTLSYATGAVSGGSNGASVGGLVGMMYGVNTVDQTYATGAVSGNANSYLGGLVGLQYEYDGEIPGISNSYAEGSVTGGTSSDVGGLVGKMTNNDTHPPVVDTSYSTGKVRGGASSDVGGLIGYALYDSGAKNLSDNYWDTTTSGITDLSQGAGNLENLTGITGLTTTQFQAGLPQGFSSTIWTENSKTNGGLPYLVGLPPQKPGVEHQLPKEYGAQNPSKKSRSE